MYGLFVLMKCEGTGCSLQLYRARSKITQLLIPTHAHFHWLKFIKNIKNSPDGLVICEQNSIFIFFYFNTFSIIA